MRCDNRRGVKRREKKVGKEKRRGERRTWFPVLLRSRGENSRAEKRSANEKREVKKREESR